MIPHSGWPSVHQNVENLSYRVTLNDELTVVHMGDADPDKTHFQKRELYWARRDTHAAFPPYWFFSSTQGTGILKDRIKPDHSVGVHVPVSMPDELDRRPVEFRDVDLFTRPGETRQIPVARAVVEEK